jgi:hypothetical protein
MSVVPHLNSCNERQWRFWADFLKEHPEITFVAKEFQTGAAIPRIAQWHIEQLLMVQERIGRGLHLLAVGGRRHIGLLLKLEQFTIIDSVPFLRTIFRRKMSRVDGRWAIHLTRRGETLDGLLRHNVDVYSTGVEQALIKRRQYSLPFGNELPTPAGNGVGASGYRLTVENSIQMNLWKFGASA